MRAWLHAKIVQVMEARFPGEGEDRTHQGGSLDSSLTPKPYFVVIMGNDTAVALGEDELSDIHRQYFMVYLHDEPGDYSRIDDIVEELKAALHNASDAATGVIRVEFLEVSRDLDDETLNTILRYVRFQAIRRT